MENRNDDFLIEDINDMDFVKEEENAVVEREFSEKDDKARRLQFFLEGLMGLIILIILMVSAGWLLIKRATPAEPEESVVVEAVTSEQPDEETIVESEVADAGNEDEPVAELPVKHVEVKGELPQKYEAGKALEYTEDDYQLPELSDCWERYALDAVADLIRLDRVRAITDSLGDSKDFYYYGARGTDGLPSGKGIAVYAHNTYYYGEWVDGKREGEGMWIRLFPNNDGVVNGITGVEEHQYSGKWKGDYPDGEGQENITYSDATALDKEAFAFRNVMGGFKAGYYNGDMYLMTEDGDGSTTDWYGTAQSGSFVTASKKKGYGGKIAIWEVGEGYDTDEEDGCHWIAPGDNLDFGIAGLKK